MGENDIVGCMKMQEKRTWVSCWLISEIGETVLTQSTLDVGKATGVVNTLKYLLLLSFPWSLPYTDRWIAATPASPFPGQQPNLADTNFWFDGQMSVQDQLWDIPSTTPMV